MQKIVQTFSMQKMACVRRIKLPEFPAIGQNAGRYYHLKVIIMKHKSLATIMMLFVFAICHGQTVSHQKNNALSLELGKTGLIYNLNFDHKFQDKNYGLRFGLGSNFSKYLQAFTTGVGSYYLIGHETNFLELGIDLNYLSVEEVSDDQGVPLIYPDYPVKTFYTSANIGYRKYGRKTLFRFGVSPGFIKDDFLPGGYISFGLTF